MLRNQKVCVSSVKSIVILRAIWSWSSGINRFIGILCRLKFLQVGPAHSEQNDHFLAHKISRYFLAQRFEAQKVKFLGLLGREHLKMCEKFGANIQKINFFDPKFV